MTEQEVFLENLCARLYDSATPEQRNEAEKALLEFSESPECLQRCLILLERGVSPYAQLVSSSTLIKLISKPNATVTLQERIELRNYVLNYMITRPKLPGFVVNSLCQLFARLTKLGWFDYTKGDEYVFRTSITEIMKQIQGSVDMYTLAVDLLGQLVLEMNQQNGLTSISKHRRIAASFRDEHLFDIFQLAVKFLRAAMENLKNINLEDEKEHTLLMGLLRMALNCLSFDFIGSVSDETSDDNISVQVPTAWRVAFIDSSIVKMFFNLYGNLPPTLATLALSCLVQLASVRRTIFNNAERQQFLVALVNGVQSVLESPQGLTDQSCYHEFCRLVARLKSNYQLSELIKVEQYAKIIRMVTDFTVQSLLMYQFSANSIHYLLSFWQRMISSMPYVKATEPHQLELFAPNVTKAYVESRVNIVTAVARDGLEDPLEDHSSLAQQLEQMSVIGRCEYEKTCQLLIQMFDQSANSYQQSISSNANQLEESLELGRLTWLVYVIGAVIGGRVSFSSSDEHDRMDGEIICRVLQLMQLTDNRLGQRGSEHLEHAYLWFLEQFRKIYISDQVQKTSKVYNKLAEVLGLNDELLVLAVFVRKIITNLKYWSQSEKIIDDTLTLLNDLSVGYSSVRKLVRLPEIQFLMSNHSSEHFSFLGPQTDLKTMRSRTNFYTALTRLLCVELNEDEDQIDQFLTPLSSAFVELSKLLSMADSIVVGHLEAKKMVIGLARDIRGVAFACNMKSAYLMLFDWLYPSYLALFQKAVQIWYADPDVTTPILKLMTELCQNRSQRLVFEVSCPNAILLFKEASKMMCEYGSRTLTITNIPKDQLFRMRLKGITICFATLKAVLSGSYVNFGVFRLYGDSCLQDALDMFIKLLLVIPQSDLLAYSKLSQNYYFLLECVAQDHIQFLSHLEPQIFVYLLQTLQEGLSALDTMVCTGCCQTLDYIISYLYRRVSRVGKPVRTHAGVQPDGTNCLRTLELHPEVLRQMLSTILTTLMFEDCRNQWSMSRPLLGLILLNETHFGQLKAQLIGAQPSVDKQNQLAISFNTLMDGVERNLSVKNKDRFTQNLAVFRREVNECLSGAQGGAEGQVAVGGDVIYPAHSDIPRNQSYADMMTA